MQKKRNPPSRASDQLHRQWDLLNLIPHFNCPKTIVALAKDLAPAHGGVEETTGELAESFLRKVQHDIEKLREVVQFLEVGPRLGGKEYWVSWARNAPPLKISGMSMAESIAFGVLKKTGMNLLPNTSLRVLEPYFSQAIADSGWLSRIARQPDTVSFISAPIDQEVEAAVHSALYNGDCLSIDYRNSSGTDVKDQVIRPLALVQRTSTMYVVAVKRGSTTPLNYALHRMLRASRTFATIAEPTDFSLQEHLASGIGHPVFDQYLYGQPVRIKLKIDQGTERWIRETRLSHDQTILETFNGYILEATVSVSEELVHWILSMGASVQVVEPPFLLRRIKETVTEMHIMYS